MFCRLTYSCIQFVQRMVPPLSINYKTKPIWLSLLYKKSGRLSTKILILVKASIFSNPIEEKLNCIIHDH